MVEHHAWGLYEPLRGLYKSLRGLYKSLKGLYESFPKGEEIRKEYPPLSSF